jgi:hypothetical protein
VMFLKYNVHLAVEPDNLESIEFEPEKNIEQICALASDVFVEGKFPPKTKINEIEMEGGRDSGNFRTLNAKTGELAPFFLDRSPYLKNLERDMKYWYSKPENANTVLVDLSTVTDEHDKEYQRIQIRGVEQPNKSIEDDRMNYQSVEVIFQFDIPKDENRTFWHLSPQSMSLNLALIDIIVCLSLF